MDTQQVIYAANSENRPPMLSEGNYIQRRSRLIRYTKSIETRKMLAKLILEGLLVEINVVVDSCESAHKMWLQVLRLLKGTEVGIQEKEAILLNEREQFTFIDGEYIDSYYHRFTKLMNDLDLKKDVDFNGGEVEQHAINDEKTCAFFKSLFNNFQVEVEKVIQSIAKQRL
ncbi:hypothetical protein Tco_0521112 [Tanacetum coccineum]